MSKGDLRGIWALRPMTFSIDVFRTLARVPSTASPELENTRCAFVNTGWFADEICRIVVASREFCSAECTDVQWSHWQSRPPLTPRSAGWPVPFQGSTPQKSTGNAREYFWLIHYQWRLMWFVCWWLCCCPARPPSLRSPGRCSAHESLLP